MIFVLILFFLYLRRKKEQFSIPVVIDVSSASPSTSASTLQFVYKVSFSNNTFSMSNEDASYRNIIAIFPSSSDSYYVLDSDLNLSNGRSNVVKVDTVDDTSYILENTGDVFLLSGNSVEQFESDDDQDIVDIAALSYGLCAVSTKGELYYTNETNDTTFKLVDFPYGKIQKIKSNHDDTIYIKTKENDEYSWQLHPGGNFTKLENENIFNDESDVFVDKNNKISLNSDNKTITISGTTNDVKVPNNILCFNAIKRNNDIIDIYIVTNQAICENGNITYNIDDENSTLIECINNCGENTYKLQDTSGGGNCGNCPNSFRYSNPADNNGIEKCKCVLCSFLSCNIFSQNPENTNSAEVIATDDDGVALPALSSEDSAGRGAGRGAEQISGQSLHQDVWER